MAISETKGQGWRLENYPYPVKECQRYINLNLANFLFSIHPKKQKGSRGSFKLLGLHLQQEETTITPQD